MEYPDTVAKLTEILRQGGDPADRGLATALFVGMSLHRPVLLEGEVGVGKTEVAKVLADTFGRRLIRLQCYEGIDTSQALYEWDYARQMLYIRALSERTLSQREGAEEDAVRQGLRAAVSARNGHCWRRCGPVTRRSDAEVARTDTRACRGARAASENRRRAAAEERAACPWRRRDERRQYRRRSPHRARDRGGGLGKIPQTGRPAAASDGGAELGILRTDSCWRLTNCSCGRSRSGAASPAESSDCYRSCATVAGPDEADLGLPRRPTTVAAATSSAWRQIRERSAGIEASSVPNASGRLISGHCRSNAGKGRRAG